jgi:hypothetical protein
VEKSVAEIKAARQVKSVCAVFIFTEMVVQGNQSDPVPVRTCVSLGNRWVFRSFLFEYMR